MYRLEHLALVLDDVAQKLWLRKEAEQCRTTSMAGFLHPTKEDYQQIREDGLARPHLSRRHAVVQPMRESTLIRLIFKAIKHRVDDRLDLRTRGVGGRKPFGIQEIALSIDRLIDKPTAEVVKPASQGIGIFLSYLPNPYCMPPACLIMPLSSIIMRVEANES